MNEHWERVESLFRQALASSPEDRRDWIARECAGDADLEREVVSLLEAHAGAGAFLQGPAGGGWASGAGGSLEGGTIGSYRVVRLLGAGGMGEVYLGERDGDFVQRVALKVIRWGRHDPGLARRFKRERRLLAGLEHPNIARLLDGGSLEDGSPYLVMEYVDGEPIDAHCDRNGLGIDERLALFLVVCRAVQHAHRALVVHRDIKPDNILVTADGSVRLLDFGIAKVLEGAESQESIDATTGGRFLMTPRYASPEQVRGEAITTATDVYSLGVVLYELLTGRRPYRVDTSSPGALERAVCDTPTPRPSDAAAGTGDLPQATGSGKGDGPGWTASRSRPRDLRGDLDWIVMRAMEKDPSRRYATAAELGDDVERRMRSEPVQAGPPSAWYRVSKFVRRNRALTVAAAAVALAVLAGLAGTSWALAREAQARKLADSRREQADAARAEAEQALSSLEEVNRFFNDDVLAAAAPDRLGLEVTVVEALGRAGEVVGERLAESPEIEATVRWTLGETYEQLGDLTKAEEHMRTALEIRERELGEDAHGTLVARSVLGRIHWRQAEYDAAERELERCLEVYRRTDRESDPSALGAMGTLANLYTDTERFELAEPLHRRVVELTEREFGVDHLRSLMQRGNLALVYLEQGRYDEAETQYAAVLERSRRVLGADAANTLTLEMSLGELFRRRGRLAEAEPLLRHARDRAIGTFGESHPFTLACMNNLGLLLRALGRHDEALEIQEQTLAIRRETLGDHPHTIASMHATGNLYRATGRLGEAESLLREAVETAGRVLGPDHWQRALFQLDLGVCLCWQHRAEEGLPMMEAAYEALARLRGEADPFATRGAQEVANVYSTQGDEERASLWRARAGAAAGPASK